MEIEDLEIGDGPVAAWGRKLFTELVVHYTDGSLAYKGPAVTTVGLWPGGGFFDEHYMGVHQRGIWLGLNGMAVGGKRRFIVDRSLVCTQIKMDADPRATCLLAGKGINSGNYVRKEKMIVQATPTDSCIPVKLMANIWRLGVNMDIWCRTMDTPKHYPKAATWPFYG